MKGRAAEFKVHVKGVRVRVVPPLDDELAKAPRAAKDVADLRKKIR